MGKKVSISKVAQTITVKDSKGMNERPVWWSLRGKIEKTGRRM